MCEVIPLTQTVLLPCGLKPNHANRRWQLKAQACFTNFGRYGRAILRFLLRLKAKATPRRYAAVACLHGPTRSRWLACVLVPWLWSWGCVGHEGDKASKLTDFRASDGSFALTYASPPWRVGERQSKSLRLVVDTKFFGFDPGQALAPSHVMIASKVNLDDTLSELLGVASLQDVLNQSRPPLGTATDDDTSTTSTAAPFQDELTSTSGDTTTESTVDEVPTYLYGVDLSHVREVAAAELEFLVREQGALIDSAMTYFQSAQGSTGVVYQAVMVPGVFVRNFYLPTRREVLRVSFISLFNLQDADVDQMVLAIITDEETDGEIREPTASE